MKKALFGILAVLLICTSCNKTTPSVANNSASNTWSFFGNSYTSLITKFTGTTLTAVTDTFPFSYNAISFVFYPTIPTANGSYKIVKYGPNPGPGQLSITQWQYPNNTLTYYNSTGNDNIYAAVTVANGKVTVIVPPVFCLSSTTATDSAQFTASIVQTQ